MLLEAIRTVRNPKLSSFRAEPIGMMAKYSVGQKFQSSDVRVKSHKHFKMVATVRASARVFRLSWL